MRASVRVHSVRAFSIRARSPRQHHVCNTRPCVCVLCHELHSQNYITVCCAGCAGQPALPVLSHVLIENMFAHARKTIFRVTCDIRTRVYEIDAPRGDRTIKHAHRKPNGSLTPSSENVIRDSENRFPKRLVKVSGGVGGAGQTPHPFNQHVPTTADDTRTLARAHRLLSPSLSPL